MGEDASQYIDKDGTIFYHWRRIIGLADRLGHEVYLDITVVNDFLASWALTFFRRASGSFLELHEVYYTYHLCMPRAHDAHVLCSILAASYKQSAFRSP